MRARISGLEYYYTIPHREGHMHYTDSITKKAPEKSPGLYYV